MSQTLLLDIDVSPMIDTPSSPTRKPEYQVDTRQKEQAESRRTGRERLAVYRRCFDVAAAHCQPHQFCTARLLPGRAPGLGTAVAVVLEAFYLSELALAPLVGSLSDRLGNRPFLLAAPLVGVGAALMLPGCHTVVSRLERDDIWCPACRPAFDSTGGTTARRGRGGSQHACQPGVYYRGHRRFRAIARTDHDRFRDCYRSRPRAGDPLWWEGEQPAGDLGLWRSNRAEHTQCGAACPLLERARTTAAAPGSAPRSVRSWRASPSSALNASSRFFRRGYRSIRHWAHGLPCVRLSTYPEHGSAASPSGAVALRGL